MGDTYLFTDIGLIDGDYALLEICQSSLQKDIEPVF